MFWNSLLFRVSLDLVLFRFGVVIYQIVRVQVVGYRRLHHIDILNAPHLHSALFCPIQKQSSRVRERRQQRDELFTFDTVAVGVTRVRSCVAL